MDMEWVLSYDRVPCPTQIAAVRVDRFWRQWEEFSSLIRPRNKSCYKWNHIGYTSGCPVDLWHINLTNQRNPDYHKQPRLLLSLSDTFWYINRHDRQLLERQPAIDDLDDLLRQVDAELDYLDAI